jgi:hypothetical protein
MQNISEDKIKCKTAFTQKYAKASFNLRPAAVIAYPI